MTVLDSVWTCGPVYLRWYHAAYIAGTAQIQLYVSPYVALVPKTKTRRRLSDYCSGGRAEFCQREEAFFFFFFFVSTAHAIHGQGV